MANNLALGLDLGTSALKAVVIDSACHVASIAARPYPLHRPGPGLAEQDPHDWWGAMIAAVRDLAAQGVQLERIAAVGLGGQMHGLVLVDADGEPLLPCQTWADARCAAEAHAVEELIGAQALRAIAGSPSSISATAAKLLWARTHLPDVYARAHKMLLPKDYLRLHLTGKWATDVSDASGTLLCDVAARTWSDELVDALGIRRALLPPVLESGDIAGTLSEGAAALLGLRAGIPVVAGAGDAECAAVGLGLAGEPGERGLGLATLGTAGQFSIVTDRPLNDPSRWTQTLCHAVPGRWHVMTAILAGASVLPWLARILAPGQDDATAVVALLTSADAEPPGARGVLFFPHLNGVRLPVADPSAAGAFVGLRPEHTQATLVRAAVEGVALALRDGLLAMRDLDIAVERVRLAGAANRAPLWPRIQADVFGVPVETGGSEDASALGAALLAAAGVGLVPSLEDAIRLASEPGVTYAPNPASARHYAEVHSQWRRVDTAVRAALSSP